MSSTTLQIGHRTMRLADIAPRRSPAFSPNLHAWMKREGHFYRNGGHAEGIYRVRPGSRLAQNFGEGTLLTGVGAHSTRVTSTSLAFRAWPRCAAARKPAVTATRRRCHGWMPSTDFGIDTSPSAVARSIPTTSSTLSAATALLSRETHGDACGTELNIAARCCPALCLTRRGLHSNEIRRQIDARASRSDR